MEVCQMSTTVESIEDAVARLTLRQRNQGYEQDALHAYTNKEGEPIYWRVRLKNPQTGKKQIWPIRFDGYRYRLKEPKFTDGKPLYNLKALTENIAAQVFVCEGEWCVDHLTEHGLLATTSGGANSAGTADWQPLAKRDVVIWPDNDPAGNQYANDVANILYALGCKVQLIDIAVLNLPEKGDVVDWLAANTYATKDSVMTLPMIDFIPMPPSENEHQETGSEKEDRTNQASILVAFVLERCALLHDHNNDVYAQDTLTMETRRIDGRQFKNWLVAEFYQMTNKSPRDQAMREAITTLSGLAKHQGELSDVYIRAALYQGCYYLDLGESGKSRAIRISANGWGVVDAPPVRFLRPDTLKPLPMPVGGADISLLWNLINIPEEAKLLVIAWLCECLRVDTPFPLLELIGEQGSAKSTTQKLLRRLIDPNACDLRAAPKTIEDIYVGANANWLVSYENISHMTGPMQDALCVLSTGGGFAKRMLYSDRDESIINVRRPVILNSISAVVTAQDLVDRTLSIEMPIISDRREVNMLEQNFEDNYGKILGALMDIFAKALSLLPSIHLPAGDRPRLTEFAYLGIAVSEAMGYSRDAFMTQFTTCRRESIARTIDASPVGSALIAWFESNERQNINLALHELCRVVEQKRTSNSDSWPKSAKGFGDALRRIAPALRQLGIECRSLGKSGSYVYWEVKARE